MARVCLLDFDGVILRKHPVHTLVQKRCEAYVGKKLKLGPKQAALVNKQLYEAHGHTVLGLRSLGCASDMLEFNKAVYQSIDYRANFDGCFSPDDPQVLDVVSMLESCAANEVTPFVFSNAPDFYCSEILHYMGITSSRARSQVSRLHVLPVCTSDGTPLLKPCADTYDSVNEILGVRPGHDTVCFVDDKLVNLVPSTKASIGWTGYLLEPNACAGRGSSLARNIWLADSLAGVATHALAPSTTSQMNKEGVIV